MAWALDRIPDLAGRVALVTGANSGIGFETVRALARHRAETVLACRDHDKAATAVAYPSGISGGQNSTLNRLTLPISTP